MVLIALSLSLFAPKNLARPRFVLIRHTLRRWAIQVGRRVVMGTCRVECRVYISVEL